MHRPWFKVFINTILRFFQPWKGRKFLLVSVCDDESNPPKLLGYQFSMMGMKP